MSEHASQVAFITWWDKYGHKQFNLPKQLLFAIPNGGARNIVTAVKLKREGVRAGVYDLCLPVPRNGFNGLWIEMKFGKNKLSAEQKLFKTLIESTGGKCIECWDWLEAKSEIEDYLTCLSAL